MALRNAGGGAPRGRASDATATRALDEFDTLAGLRRSTYALEHLATFTVTRETGIVYPADGMRRLLQLEKTNGIWSQKMQLSLEGQWVLVMDYETGSIMERFPASWVHSPTAFTSPEPAELYNNVLAFVVEAPESGGSPAGARRELHIFQCHDVGAQALVEELNALKGEGGGGSEGGRDFVIERERERERENDLDRPRRQQMSAQLGRGDRPDRDRGGSAGERDDASSTGSERLYEQDIAILNRCFDDIEKFIARLQHAAAASRELERRRRSRGGKRSAGTGEGMLALRTRPPPERDFVDVLQKFKLSFNLLARLRAHIHDPNAPELVHFLFTPLALIVDAAQDVADGRLPARVVQPLLTRDALNLLANCVTSKETELWHSLGDAWLIPREQWKTTIPPYQPVFMDGWSPDYQVDDQPLRRNPRTLTREDSGSAASSPEREPPYRADRDEDELGEAWARGVAARGGRVVRVTYPRTANNDKELTVVRGEYLEVLDDSRKWWKARNRRGQTAHVPHTIVAPAISPPGSPAPDALLYPNPIYTHYQEGGGRGSGGSSPTGQPEPEPRKPEKSVPPPPPPPPPPPEPPAPAPVLPAKTDTMKSTKSAISTSSGLHEELKMVLPQITQRRLDIKKTPDIFIHQKSNPEEVVQWLEAKGFSSTAQKQLRVSGHQLFALSRSQLERVVGADEGKRLYSQILVQRNVSGYKTTSASELASILRKVREKVEVS
ncbi:epidermal growth factor receptor kinase substrate 8-like isoform X2 [Danaus plexippus]|uniref:epidermal growth factor receptor kinase substrate 8-like isoform X2 n=1 Tax=Danaus plexippus TaxID=13037 RepID=UPI0013C483C2|nr:epidermal growth factor receptor kinase substrate 8-like isoform X2 [Danaus plexippus]